MNDKAKILVVEDTDQHFKLLQAILSKEPYDLTRAKDGAEALKLIHPDFDIVLLDMMLPDMNGLDVARKFRENEGLRTIPILAVTALDSVEDKVRALEAGADDFLSKPYDRTEMKARVRAHLKTSKYFKQLKDSYEQIKNLEKMKSDLTHMIVHDMGNSLQSVMGYLELLNGEEARFTPDMKEWLQTCMVGAEELLNMRDNILDVERMTEGKMPLRIEDVAIGGVFQSIVNKVKVLLAERGAKIEVQVEDGMRSVKADETLLKRAVENLVLNAVKHNPGETTVKLKAHRNGSGSVRVEVEDNGAGIPKEIQDKIFEKFSQAELKKKGYKMGKGLGLTFCKLVAEAHGGSIRVESDAGKGTRFVMELPQ